VHSRGEGLARFLHHPKAIDTLDELFVGAQERPPWPVRHDAMLH